MDYKFNRFDGIYIPKKESFVEEIKDFLIRRVFDFQSQKSISYKFYREIEDQIIVPRFFPLQKFVYSSSITDNTPSGQNIEINHHIEPRNESQIKAIMFLMNNEHGMIQLIPGSGKTVISIYMIAERKKKTFILVHRDSLVDQWIERLKEFTDVKDNQIVRLRSESFVDDLNHDIIISTAQTFISLLKRKEKEFLSELKKSNIGIFIADEVHTSVGAPTFSLCSLHIPAKYVYGLSATPYRNDGTGDILEYHLGKIFRDTSTSGTMDAKVTFILFDYSIDTPQRFKYLHWNKNFQRSRYLNLLRKSKSVVKISLGLLDKLIKNNRNILFVSERIKLINDLYDQLNFNDKSKFIENAKLDQLEHKVVFSTPGKIRDGIDIPQKDTLIMTSPISNIEQMTGRVLRISDGKQQPHVIDMVDVGCNTIKKTFYQRYKFYQSKGWKIQFMLFHKGKSGMINKEIALKIIGQL
jgi:superfamily II DNA or RNA helicase